MNINGVENVPENYKDWIRILIELGYKSRLYSEDTEITNRWVYIDPFGEEQWCVDFIEFTENHIPVWKPAVYEFKLTAFSDTVYSMTYSYNYAKALDRVPVATNIKDFRDMVENQIKLFKEIKIKTELKKIEQDFKE